MGLSEVTVVERESARRDPVYPDPISDRDSGAQWWTAPRAMSFSTTRWWHDASEVERLTHSRQEAADTAAWLIRFELTLVDIIARELRKHEPDDRACELATEGADEFRHIRMFMRLIDRTHATPSSGALAGRILLWLIRSRAGGQLPSFLAVYIVESYVQALHTDNLEADVELVPVAAHTYARHTSDERRHLQIAESWIARAWVDASPSQRQLLRVLTPLLAAAVCYTARTYPSRSRLGPVTFTLYAVRSRTHRARARRRLREASVFLCEIGVIDRRSAQLWRALGLRG